VTILLIAVGGAFGSVLRYLVDGWVLDRVGTGFPFGTLAVNLTGALALGVLHGAGVGGDAFRLAGTGLLGGYTTFSTWTLESHRLGEDGRLRRAALNLLGSLALGIGFVWLGSQIGGAL
jgi:CrcB protein